jgi:hypothetical protein
MVPPKPKSAATVIATDTCCVRSTFELKDALIVGASLRSTGFAPSADLAVLDRVRIEAIMRGRSRKRLQTSLDASVERGKITYTLGFRQVLRPRRHDVGGLRNLLLHGRQ